MLRVTVPLAERAYDVVVGDGAISELAGILPASSLRVAVVTQDAVPMSVSLPDHEIERFVIGNGEAAKSFATIEELGAAFTELNDDAQTRVIVLRGDGKAGRRPHLWDGEAATRIVAILFDALSPARG